MQMGSALAPRRCRFGEHLVEVHCLSVLFGNDHASLGAEQPLSSSSLKSSWRTKFSAMSASVFGPFIGNNTSRLRG